MLSPLIRAVLLSSPKSIEAIDLLPAGFFFESGLDVVSKSPVLIPMFSKYVLIRGFRHFGNGELTLQSLTPWFLFAFIHPTSDASDSLNFGIGRFNPGTQLS